MLGIFTFIMCFSCCDTGVNIFDHTHGKKIVGERS